ncbi:MAG: hypothetical protein ACYTXT_32975, partial [Nostoc sp.]
ITGITKPAYAFANDFTALPQNSDITIHQEDSGTVKFNYVNSPANEETTDDTSKVFVNNIVNGAVTTAKVTIAGGLLCFLIDGVATAFYPPAAQLGIFCPVVGAASGGAKAVLQKLY